MTQQTGVRDPRGYLVLGIVINVTGLLLDHPLVVLPLLSIGIPIMLASGGALLFGRPPRVQTLAPSSHPPESIGHEPRQHEVRAWLPEPLTNLRQRITGMTDVKRDQLLQEAAFDKWTCVTIRISNVAESGGTANVYGGSPQGDSVFGVVSLEFWTSAAREVIDLEKGHLLRAVGRIYSYHGGFNLDSCELVWIQRPDEEFARGWDEGAHDLPSAK